MPNEHYSHLFLRNVHSRRDYTNPSQGGSSPKIKQQDRDRHGALLMKRFEDTWKETEDRRAIGQVTHYGMYVDFISEPGFDLILKSLETVRSGIRLLNVRRTGEGAAEVIRATVFIPSDKKKILLNKLTKYAEEVAASGKPKNQKLVESISDIRRTVLESFWQDGNDTLPGREPTWVEIWLSNDKDEVIDRFKALVVQKKYGLAEGVIKFPERSVIAVKVTRAQLENLIEESDDVAELRRAKDIAAEVVNLEQQGQVRIVQELLGRTVFETGSDVSICVLDTGVNNGHLLLGPILLDADRHTVNESWGKHDHHGHGTWMAGLAAYGDLLGLINSTSRVHVSHVLESSKILPPPPGQNESNLWGYFTSQGVSLAEIQESGRKRIICLATTTTDNLDRGRPSSWSAKIDELASGADGSPKRLFIVSAGNVDDPADWRRYLVSNRTKAVHDPAQSWNALTVGAFTEKAIITNETYRGWEAIAPRGGLSPFSTTSLEWKPTWPIKPEVLFEGGNVAKGPNNSILPLDELGLISTSHEPVSEQFVPFNMTSAATAQAAWMAAKIQKIYPEAWPETVRALMVHSASWTDSMKTQFVQNGEEFNRDLFRCCGYGVPNLNAALFCASNSLTLISQAEMQPFGKNSENRLISKDMHFYRLPWPIEELRALQDTLVEMRVTLSYFTEPGPGEVGWKDRYRYPSFALRFNVKGPNETPDQFAQRINDADRENDEHPGTSGPSDKWVIGKIRDVGSIHSDIWRGTAADLANSGYIAVCPVVGWWRERSHLERWDKTCRYSLIVSIKTPETSQNIYVPVASQIGVPVPIVIRNV